MDANQHDPHAWADHMTEGQVLPVPVVAQANSKQLWGKECHLMGWSFVESTGAAAATVWLYDGQDATGSVVAVIPLAAGASSSLSTGLLGIACRGGLYMAVKAGSVTGATWVRG